MQDLEKLPKLEATIQETLRLNPNAPMLFKATCNKGLFVPANCLLVSNTYHINYNTATFPDLTAFPTIGSPWWHIQT